MKTKIRATVGAIIVKNKKILLGKRNVKPFEGYWSLPGGHVEIFEKIENAVIRETQEETGLIIKPKFFRFYNEIIKKINWHAVALIFVGENPKGKLKINKESSELEYIPYKKIKNLKLAFNHKTIINDFLEKNKNL